MTPHESEDLRAQRERLRMRSAQLREQIAAQAQLARPALRLADRLQAGTGWVRDHPELLGVLGSAVLGAVAVRPRRALALGLRLWSGWQVFQRVRPVVSALMGRR